jgi:hypothetical protein
VEALARLRHAEPVTERKPEKKDASPLRTKGSDEAMRNCIVSLPQPNNQRSMTLDQIQMDELLDSLQELTAAVKELVSIARQLVGPEMPEECQTHTCTYYTHYLAYGPADLTHEGFHQAERMGDEHIRNCTRTHNAPHAVCPICTRWEVRLRA